MPEETEKVEEVNEEACGTAAGDTGHVGSSPVGPIGILLIAGYLILMSIMLVYGIVQFWPGPVPENGVGPAALPVRFLFWSFSVSEEVRLLLIVALAGALGGQVRSLRSLAWYVGNRILRRSWLILYILTPLVGATLALAPHTSRAKPTTKIVNIFLFSIILPFQKSFHFYSTSFS
jgi:hypothetical protein